MWLQFPGAPAPAAPAARPRVCLGWVSLVTVAQGHSQPCLAPDKHSLCVHARFARLPVCLHACLFVSGWGGGWLAGARAGVCGVCVCVCGGGGGGWVESRDRTGSTVVKCVFWSVCPCVLLDIEKCADTKLIWPYFLWGGSTQAGAMRSPPLPASKGNIDPQVCIA